MNNEIISRGRALMLNRIFPEGVPTLWCPPLTHYQSDGSIDKPRIEAHLRHLSKWVKGFLIPGSTSDGWELSPEEQREVLELSLQQAERLNFRILIAALRRDGPGTLNAILDTMKWLESRLRNCASQERTRIFETSPICGFTVCAPSGRNVTEGEMETAFTAVLETGLPIALYQLPQITQNEFSPELTAKLAKKHDNFLLLKDSSGGDRIALSKESLGGVFMMRGGEGDYFKWLKQASGPYDGFLLGSANCFSEAHSQMIEDVQANRTEKARDLSDRVTAVVKEAAQAVIEVPEGNPFANANKALDHFFAWGPNGLTAPAPRLRGGSAMPEHVLQAARRSLLQHKLMPKKGYLE
jgi:dihydrodipicolinate synthase/N-acetylneuraminate lyase